MHNQRIQSQQQVQTQQTQAVTEEGRVREKMRGYSGSTIAPNESHQDLDNLDGKVEDSFDASGACGQAEFFLQYVGSGH
jgi:transcription initiation factor TFIID subunit TAF12